MYLYTVSSEVVIFCLMFRAVVTESILYRAVVPSYVFMFRVEGGTRGGAFLWPDDDDPKLGRRYVDCALHSRGGNRNRSRRSVVEHDQYRRRESSIVWDIKARLFGREVSTVHLFFRKQRSANWSSYFGITAI